jgi:hypothetical protein
MTEPCWVCGDPATSREHRSKASDLKALFGKPSQRGPIYMHTAGQKNRPIGSLKSNALKYSHRLCETCNTSRTQPHDYAWEHFSEVMRSSAPEIAQGKFLRFNKLFPYDTRAQMLNVHLYFVKLLGCQLVEAQIALDTSPCANAILRTSAHPNMYLRFGLASPEARPMASGSDVHVVNDGESPVACSWIQQVDCLCVQVIFTEPHYQPDGLATAWHPKFGTNRFFVCDFDAE